MPLFRAQRRTDPPEAGRRRTRSRRCAVLRRLGPPPAPERDANAVGAPRRPRPHLHAREHARTRVRARLKTMVLWLLQPPGCHLPLGGRERLYIHPRRSGPDITNTPSGPPRRPPHRHRPPPLHPITPPPR